MVKIGLYMYAACMRKNMIKLDIPSICHRLSITRNRRNISIIDDSPDGVTKESHFCRPQQSVDIMNARTLQGVSFYDKSK